MHCTLDITVDESLVLTEHGTVREQNMVCAVANDVALLQAQDCVLQLATRGSWVHCVDADDSIVPG